MLFVIGLSNSSLRFIKLFFLLFLGGKITFRFFHFFFASFLCSSKLFWMKSDLEFLIRIFASFLALLAIVQSSSFCECLAFNRSLSFSKSISSSSSVIQGSLIFLILNCFWGHILSTTFSIILYRIDQAIEGFLAL